VPASFALDCGVNDDWEAHLARERELNFSVAAPPGIALLGFLLGMRHATDHQI
jgi:hypothetical protein